MGTSIEFRLLLRIVILSEAKNLLSRMNQKQILRFAQNDILLNWCREGESVTFRDPGAACKRTPFDSPA
jgi:hypothetical protein